MLKMVENWSYIVYCINNVWCARSLSPGGLGVPGSHPSVLLNVEVVFMLSGLLVGTV